MFLSSMQLWMLEEIVKKGPLDLLEAPLNTVAALQSRGLVSIKYRKTSREWSTVMATPTGTAIGLNANSFSNLPRYKEVLAQATPHKRQLKKLVEMEAA